MYSRVLNGKLLTLAPSGWTYKRTFVLYDKESLSLWYPVRDGLVGISGEHLDEFLPRLNSVSTQWRWWVDDHPDSKVLK